MKRTESNVRRSEESGSTSVPQAVAVENVNVPGYTRRVDAAKYAVMQRALLRALPSKGPGVTQAEMFAAVRAHLPEDLFPGGDKANWWAKTVQLDLEKKGVVRRSTDAKPLRWFRRARPRSSASTRRGLVTRRD